MINVLLNYYNFDGEWAYNHLERFVRNKRPLIIPLAYREGQVWDTPAGCQFTAKTVKSTIT